MNYFTKEGAKRQAQKEIQGAKRAGRMWLWFAVFFWGSVGLTGLFNSESRWFGLIILLPSLYVAYLLWGSQPNKSN